MSSPHGFATTKWLCHALSPYGGIDDIPADTRAWAQLLKTADRGLVLPRLALVLDRQGSDVPPEVRDYLEAALELNRIRNFQLRDQLLALLDHFNAAGIVPAVMKGATTLLEPGGEIGRRVMLDIDIWTPEPADQQRAITCLHDLGYHMEGSMEDHAQSQHFPPFFRDDTLSRIELHHRMVEPVYDALVDENSAVRNLTETEFEGRRFLSLDPADALRLSYVQCRWAGDNHVTLMKWFDLLERVKAAGIAEVLGPMSLGLTSDGEPADARLLTALSRLCGLPYRGPIDTGLIAAWEKRHNEATASRFLDNIIGNALDPRKWRNRSAGELWTALAFRVRSLPASLRRARNWEEL